MLFTSKKLKTKNSTPKASLNLAHTSLRTERLVKDKPKLFKWLGFGILGLLLLIYLGWQVGQILAAPKLIVLEPADQSVFQTAQIVVRGQVNIESELSINDEQVLINDDGSFLQPVNLHSGLNIFVVEAKKRYSQINKVIINVYLRDEPVVIYK